MRVLDLFSGIGGFSLAARWAGMQTAAFCEIDPYCRKVLAKNFTGVPIYGDIRELTADRLLADGIGQIDIITGGFPCQPFSAAGKRQGAADDRHLWPEMLRIIQQVRPAWIVGENVAGFIRMALDNVLSDLEDAGYETETLVLPACAAGAPHRRERVWIVAYSAQQPGNGIRNHRTDTTYDGEDRVQTPPGRNGGSADMADPASARLEIGETGRLQQPVLSTQYGGMEIGSEGVISYSDQQGSQGHGRLPECAGEWLTWQGGTPFEGIWQFEPDVGRVAHGVPGRVDRLKALGNAVVPQVVYPILQAIMDNHQQ